MSAPMIVVKQSNGVELFLSLRTALVIGRECDGLLLADGQVSRRHLELTTSSDRVLATDLGSTNGTFLDGVRLTSPVVLMPGSVLRLGGTTIERASDPAGSGEVRRPGTTTVGATEIDRSSGGGPSSAVARQSASGRPQTSIERVLSSVEEDVPDLAPMADDQGTVTIGFSDIESSTALAVRVGDDRWLQILRHHDMLLRREIERHGGTIVKHRGDGFMFSFPGARRAILAMIEVQRALARTETEQPELAVRVRVGLHTGEVIAHDGDLHGRHVVLAARIGDAADGGQILVSDLVKQLTAARGDLDFGDASTMTFKGIDGDHVVYPVAWTAQD